MTNRRKARSQESIEFSRSQRYEDSNYSTTWLFFLVGFILTVLSVGGFVFATWGDVIGIGITDYQSFVRAFREHVPDQEMADTR